MAIKDLFRGGSGGEHPHGNPRGTYYINKVPNTSPMGTSSVPNSAPVEESYRMDQVSNPMGKDPLLGLIKANYVPYLNDDQVAEADAMVGHKTGKVPPMVTADGIKQAAINAGNKAAISGYGSAAIMGAAAGGALLGGGVNLAAGEVGHPAENLPVMDTPQMMTGMAAGAALGVAGKFAKDTLKTSKSSRKK